MPALVAVAGTRRRRAAAAAEPTPPAPNRRQLPLVLPRAEADATAAGACHSRSRQLTCQVRTGPSHGPCAWRMADPDRRLRAEQEARAASERRAESSANDLLAAADPFTETVQKGDKALYRARFAGFDKDQAEAACKQLKRSDIDCMALKN